MKEPRALEVATKWNGNEKIICKWYEWRLERKRNQIFFARYDLWCMGKLIWKLRVDSWPLLTLFSDTELVVVALLFLPKHCLWICSFAKFYFYNLSSLLSSSRKKEKKNDDKILNYINTVSIVWESAKKKWLLY